MKAIDLNIKNPSLGTTLGLNVYRYASLRLTSSLPVWFSMTIRK